MTGKLVGEQAGWHVLSSRIVLDEKRMTVREDSIRLHGTDTITYVYHQAAPAVLIVPVSPSGDMLLTRQYRYPVDQWLLEIPAGGTSDFPQMSLEDIARLELRQELGAEAGHLEHIASFFSNVSSSTQQSHVYLATDVRITGQPEREKTEEMQTQSIPLREVVDRVKAGDMQDGQSALAIFLCLGVLESKGLLP